ncbi:MAG: PAS domain S-box protein, partial [Burkholderiales bacterium]|nr:PAS domain S-box protein [Burkholderiales bacterium]
MHTLPSLRQLALGEIMGLPFMLLQFVAVLGILSFVLMFKRGKGDSRNPGWFGYGWILGITGYLITGLVSQFIQGPSKPYIRNDILFMAGMLGGWQQASIAYLWIIGGRIQFTGTAYLLSSLIDMATVWLAGSLVHRWMVSGAPTTLSLNALVKTWLVRTAAGIAGVLLVALFDTGPPEYSLFLVRRLVGAPSSFFLYFGIYWLFKVDDEQRQRVDSERTAYEKRIEMQRELARRDSEIRHVADNIPALVAGWTREGQCISVNREFCRCFGIQDPASIIGQGIREVIGAANWETIGPGFEAATRGTRVNFDCELRLQQGSARVDVTCVAEGEPAAQADRVFLLIVSIEGRKRAEDAVRQREKLLIAAMDSIAEGLIMTDRQGRISRMNPVAEALTGWSVAQAAGRAHAEVLLCESPDAAAQAGTLIDAALGERATQHLQNALLIARDGSERLINAAAAPIALDNEEPIGAIVVFRDITEESLIRAELQRHDRLQSIGLLVGGVAHDFNNLLASINGAAALEALERDALDADRKNLSIILVSARRAAELVRRLTDFAGNRQTEFAPLDVGMAVRETVEMLSRTTPRTIEISFAEAAPGALMVSGNAAALQSVLLNLAVNACHSMPDGGELNFCCAAARVGPGGLDPGPLLAAGRYVEIAVRDSGCGIAKEHMDKIFDPFFTTKERGLGTGLGLASAYGVVRDHGGWIGVESSVGVGTTVRVLLPEWRESGEFEGDAAPAADGDAKGLVLFVDDDPLFSGVGASMLGALGYAVAAARNGAQALEQYRKLAPELQAILIDLDMPVLGGRLAVLELRQAGARCRIVLTTGRTDAETQAMLESMGVDAVLFKPFSLDDLRRAMAPAPTAAAPT